MDYTQAGGLVVNNWVSQTNFDDLFKLKKIGERKNEKFTLTQTKYQVEIKKLSRYFNHIESLIVLPHIFKAILAVCTNDFKPNDRIIIELACQDLDPSIYLHVRHFKDFNIDLLMAQTEKLNSSKK